MPQVEQDRRLERRVVDRRLDASNDAAASAKWDQCDLRGSRPVHDSSDLRLGTRVGNEIGYIVVVPNEAARIVRKRLAVSVGDPVVDVDRAVSRQRRRRRYARRAQRNFGKRRRATLVETVNTKQPAIAVEGGTLLIGCQTLAFTPPAEIFEPAFRHHALPGREFETIAQRPRLSNLEFVGLLVE